MRLKTST